MNIFFRELQSVNNTTYDLCMVAICAANKLIRNLSLYSAITAHPFCWFYNFNVCEHCVHTPLHSSSLRWRFMVLISHSPSIGKRSNVGDLKSSSIYNY